MVLFEAENRPTGRGIHHILIYFPPSHLLVSNIGKKKLDLLTYKNQNFCFKTFTLSDLLTHTSARPGIFTDSLNIFKFLILRSFHLHAFSATQYFLFYVFKLLLHLNYSFFSANAGHKQEGVTRSRFTSQALNFFEITRYTNN